MEDNNSFGRKVARMVVVVIGVLASLMLILSLVLSGCGLCALCFGSPEGEALIGSLAVLFAGAFVGSFYGWIPLLLLCWLGRKVLSPRERRIFFWIGITGVVLSVLSFGLSIVFECLMLH